MIPVALNVRNFMSYTDVHEPLRFDGIHVAVLSGDNGHGKSALLDAITWSLWGRSRAKSVDDLIHTGATEMEVEYEFRLADAQYRVIRKRQRRGKTGSSTLEFAVLSANGYRPLTERSVAETEAAIQRTLKMSYETFTNSSFIQQGRADAFTTNQPAERKRILAEILELGLYDEYEQRAKDALLDRKLSLEKERARTREWDEELARKPEHEAKLVILKADLTALDAQVQKLEADGNTAREKVARLTEIRSHLETVTANVERIVREGRLASTNLEKVRSELAAHAQVLARAAAIELAARELKQAREALQEADGKQDLYLPLERQQHQAEADLKAEEARIEADMKNTLARVTELRDLVADLPRRQQECAEAKQAAEALKALETEESGVRQEHNVCLQAAGEKRAQNQQLKREMEEIRTRMEEAASMEICPSCQRPMDASHRERLRAEYARQGVAKRDEFRLHEREAAELEATRKALEDRLKLLGSQLGEREAVQRRQAVAESAAAASEEARTRLAGHEKDLAELERLVQTQTFALEARASLRDATARIKVLAFDPQRHVGLRKQVAELASVDGDLHSLETARVASDHLRRSEQELTETRARLEDEYKKEHAEQQRLDEQSKSFDSERVGLEKLEADLRAQQAVRDRCREQVTQTEGAIQYCVFLEGRREESVRKQDALIREQQIYADLATAFGKRGVQALIIETAIPEIEDEANRLLARMTDGRMSVRFETQKDTRAGTGVIETLDIKISDELGTRSYEMFSGGESFRVNFAIRVALSRLLASRAGTRLQLLVVDEGFGSQDQDGRDRIVEAIQAIQDEFEKILVITHLEDLRERFPVRIEVRKTPQGSVYELR